MTARSGGPEWNHRIAVDDDVAVALHIKLGGGVATSVADGDGLGVSAKAV